MRRHNPLLSRTSCLILIACLILSFPARPFADETEPPTEPETPVPPESTEEVPPETGAAQALADAPGAPGAILQGRVLHTDRKTPWVTAVVYAVTPDNAVYSSVPADERGRYSLIGLPPATYQLAVVTEDGVFSLANPLGISSASEFTVDLVVVPADAATGTVPGVAASPRGYCYILQGRRGTSFWTSRRGTVTLVAAGAGLVFAISELDDDHKDRKSVSPSAP